MTDWAYVDGEIIQIDWSEVFDNANNYDSGDTSFDSQLGKMISLIQRRAFERGYFSGCQSKHPQDVLLSFTGGNA